jgi:ribonucleotide monophosphatase NagD (HAD superfamily)
MGEEFTWSVLNAAFRSLRGGARLIATQKGRRWRTADGWCLDAGAFVVALEFAAEVEAEVIGKPSPGFFRMAAHLLGEEAGSLVMVGDDLEADVGGGLDAALTTVLVRTGKFDADRLAATPPERAPHHVIDSIRDLPDLLGG